MNNSSDKKERSKVIGILFLNAIQNNDTPLLQRLLSKFSAEEVNAGSLSGNYTSLHVAAGDGNVEAVGELLKKKGIDLNIRGVDGYTPIMVAAWLCNVGVVKLLLENPNVILDYRDKLGRTIEEIVGQSHKLGSNSSVLEEEIKKMIKIGRDNKERIEKRVRSQSINGMLCAAIHNGDLDSVKNGLIFCPIDELNKQDMNGYTPLHWACVKNKKDIVKLLVENEDVDVNVVDEEGFTPDQRAAWLCSNDCLRLLLQNNRVEVLNWEAELFALAGKAFVCTNKQKNETITIIKEEIARRKTMAENKADTNVGQSSKSVVPKECLFHLHRRRIKVKVKQDLKGSFSSVNSQCSKFHPSSKEDDPYSEEDYPYSKEDYPHSKDDPYSEEEDPYSKEDDPYCEEDNLYYERNSFEQGPRIRDSGKPDQNASEKGHSLLDFLVLLIASIDPEFSVENDAHYEEDDTYWEEDDPYCVEDDPHCEEDDPYCEEEDPYWEEDDSYCKEDNLYWEREPSDQGPRIRGSGTRVVNAPERCPPLSDILFMLTAILWTLSAIYNFMFTTM